MSKQLFRKTPDELFNDQINATNAMYGELAKVSMENTMMRNVIRLMAHGMNKGGLSEEQSKYIKESIEKLNIFSF